AATIETAVFHRRRPGIVAPAFAVTNRDYVGMAVEQHRAPAAGSLPRRDDIGAPLITAINRDIAGMLLERFPIRFPHVDLKVELLQIIGKERLDSAFITGDAGDSHNLLEEFDRLIPTGVDCFENLLSGLAHLIAPYELRGFRVSSLSMYAIDSEAGLRRWREALWLPRPDCAEMREPASRSMCSLTASLR